MAKQSISVTLETKTIENIRNLAAEEYRTVSNMLEYIIARHMLEREKTNSEKYARAAVFGTSVKIVPYKETQETLKKNVIIDEKDLEFLGKK